MKKKSIGVFCGASPGKSNQYTKLATNIGKILAQKGFTIVYGGGNVGLMGALAEGALLENGKVIGIIPSVLKNKEVAHTEIAQLILTDSMHERKEKIYELSQKILVLPGGIGTLDELFETLTWNQLLIHNKPVYILNFGGFYDHLIEHFKTIVQEEFLLSRFFEQIKIFNNVEDLLDALTDISN